MLKSTTAFDAKPEAHRLIEAKGHIALWQGMFCECLRCNKRIEIVSTGRRVDAYGLLHAYKLAGLGAKRCPNARSKVVTSDPDYHHDLEKEGG